MRHSSKRQAFTLIEVLLVVTIMAILTVSGLRGLINVQRSARVNDMRDRFLSFLDIARSYSLNGKQVNCTLAPNAGTLCVPKSFGVAIIDDATCAGSGKKIVQFFFEDDTEKNILAKNILDSYCRNPQTVITPTYPAGVTAPLITQFSYLTPFGTFNPGYNSQGVNAIILEFCDGSVCDTKTALKKSITLYSNVGVPE